MKRLFFLCLFSYIVYCISYIVPVFALDPVIITDAKHSYPADSQDQNYIPSDPNAVDTVPLEHTLQLTQTFSPIIAGTDAEGNTVYQNQTIDHVEQNLNSSDLHTDFYHQDYDYFARSTYDPTAPASTSYYASNATRHSLPASVQKCLLSNQMVDIAKFIAGGNSICIDRNIKTSLGTFRVSEIVSALIDAGDLLYYPDSGCPPNQTPEAFPSDVSTSLKSTVKGYHLSVDDYRQIYDNSIEPICANSLAQSVRHCDLNDQGQEINCKEELRSQPLGAVAAQNSRNYLPAAAQTVSRDYTNSQNSLSASDKPNSLSWLASFFKLFFEGELRETKTYSGPHTVTTAVDQRQIDGLQNYETTALNLLPAATIKSQNLNSLPSSGTDGVTTDPGYANSALTNTLRQNLKPAAW